MTISVLSGVLAETESNRLADEEMTTLMPLVVQDWIASSSVVDEAKTYLMRWGTKEMIASDNTEDVDVTS